MRDFVNDEQTRVASTRVESLRVPQFRDALLEQSVELISRAQCAIWILAGDLSWLDTLCIPLLAAKSRGVDVRIISAEQGSGEAYVRAVEGAVSLGASVVELPDTSIAATIVDEATPVAAMITIESRPHPHGAVYRAPEGSQPHRACVRHTSS